MDSGEQYVMTALIVMTVMSYVECLDSIFHGRFYVYFIRKIPMSLFLFILYQLTMSSSCI